jgi:antitoxin (DNA-binding transcriptional repressor) of toxin-antitoxin stability system
MKVVGIRELKNRLSEYLRLVRSGEDVLVTDRGAVVAELRPPGATSVEMPYPRLIEWDRDGKAHIGATNRPDLYPELQPMLKGCTANELLLQERGER